MMLRVTYLALAVLGAWGPLSVMFEAFFVGTSHTDLVKAYRSYTGGPIASLGLLIWLVSETYVRKNWVALWAVPATLLLGVSCGLPLFLFLRSRPIL